MSPGQAGFQQKGHITQSWYKNVMSAVMIAVMWLAVTAETDNCRTHLLSCRNVACTHKQMMLRWSAECSTERNSMLHPNLLLLYLHHWCLLAHLELSLSLQLLLAVMLRMSINHC